MLAICSCVEHKAGKTLPLDANQGKAMYPAVALQRSASHLHSKSKLPNNIHACMILSIGQSFNVVCHLGKRAAKGLCLQTVDC